MTDEELKAIEDQVNEHDAGHGRGCDCAADAAETLIAEVKRLRIELATFGVTS